MNKLKAFNINNIVYSIIKIPNHSFSVIWNINTLFNECSFWFKKKDFKISMTSEVNNKYESKSLNLKYKKEKLMNIYSGPFIYI